MTDPDWFDRDRGADGYREPWHRYDVTAVLILAVACIGCVGLMAWIGYSWWTLP